MDQFVNPIVLQVEKNSKYQISDELLLKGFKTSAQPIIFSNLTDLKLATFHA